MRAAARDQAGQDDDFVDDPLFDELLCNGSGGNVGAVGRSNPGWLSS